MGSHLQNSLDVVSAARADCLRALERLSDDHLAAATAVDAMVALQGAANELGVIERRLAELRAPDDAPPPIADAAPEGDFPWSGQALGVLALAESSVPYGAGPAGELESWLRVLRREAEGKVGQALRELGFPDGELTARAEPAATAHGRESVEAIRRRATELARRRHAATVTTTDVLFAVLAEYPRPLVQRALYERGITEDALLARLGAGAPASPRT